MKKAIQKIRDWLSYWWTKPKYREVLCQAQLAKVQKRAETLRNQINRLASEKEGAVQQAKQETALEYQPLLDALWSTAHLSGISINELDEYRGKAQYLKTKYLETAAANKEVRSDELG